MKKHITYCFLSLLLSVPFSMQAQETEEQKQKFKEELEKHEKTNKEISEGNAEEEAERLAIVHEEAKKKANPVKRDVPFSKKEYKGRDNYEEFKEAYKELKDGDYYYEMHNPSAYKKAAKHYLKAQAFNDSNSELNYKLGKCYITALDKKKAFKYFDTAYELNPKVADDIKFMLAESHHIHEDWSKAIEWYEKYKEELYNGTEDTTKIKDKVEAVEKKIVECAFGIHFSANPEKVQIDNIGGKVNSEYPEYNVMITADESAMYFTSQRPEGTTQEMRNIEFYTEDIYRSTKEGKEWTTPVLLGDSVNDPLRHDGIMAISPDGQQMIIYRDDKGDGNLYWSELDGGDWTIPTKMPSPINSEYHESAASFSQDGNVIYFCSDRPGGFGKHDIYASTWDAENSKWGEAKNLGEVINTKYNENGVFKHPDGVTLYFSSQGHSSMGGFDIFKTEIVAGQFTEPENLGYPVNRADNDLLLVISSNGDRGYYSSYTEEGYGEEDIYVITFKEHKPLHLTILKGKILDAVTHQPVYAAIDIIDVDSNKVIHEFHSNKESGDYLISLPSGRNYAIEVDEKDHLFHSENFDIPLIEGYQEIHKDIQLKKIAVGSSIVLKNIFFETAKSDLKPTSIAELERLKKFLDDVPNVVIEVSGHTDNVGSDKYNKKLSKERAQAVVLWLVEHGIDMKRLEYKGYGEDKPIASNEDEFGRALNRRTEFKIIKNDFGVDK